MQQLFPITVADVYVIKDGAVKEADVDLTDANFRLPCFFQSFGDKCRKDTLHCRNV